MTAPDRRTELAHLIARLQAEGGSANRVVVSAGGADGSEVGGSPRSGSVFRPGARWLVITAMPGSAKATVQIADGRHLPTDAPLPAEVGPDLLAAGFRRRSAADPWATERAAADTERVAGEVIGWAERLFGGVTGLDLQLGHAPRLENQALLERMRAAGQVRDLPTRNRLYHGLVRARFIVPLVEPLASAQSGGASLSLRAAGELHGEPVSALFTDWETCARWDPRGLPLTVMAGLDVFPLLASRRFVSVLINPTGAVGGELYRHEVETIAEGCRRLQGLQPMPG